MSKIYEALLRAEIDRLAAGPEAAQNGSDERRNEERAREETNSNHAQQSVADVPHSPAPLDSIVLDPNQVKRTVWKPAMAHLPALEERGSVVEQLRSLRSRLYQFRDLNTLKVVSICSGLPQEGKSFIAVNLALSLGRHKAARVLLIDGDMRRGTLHTRLGTPSEPGLTEYLSGQATLAQVLQQALPPASGSLPAGLSSLTFIASGGDADNAADLSGNSRFAGLLSTLRDSFDWIIVDTSPVNLVADGINLARTCDGVLLITRGGVTRFQTAQRAVQELKAAKLLGVVLNAVDDAPAIGGYYGYDAYEKIKS